MTHNMIQYPINSSLCQYICKVEMGEFSRGPGIYYKKKLQVLFERTPPNDA